MSFAKLLKHAKIGWDFDGTLYDHDKSELMHKFIMDNPDIQHYIITFRSHGWAKDIFPDIKRLYKNTLLCSDHFVNVFGIPDETYETEYLAHKTVSNGRVSVSPTKTFVHWKAKKCKEIGATILIDDMRDSVERGCIYYGIDYLHPDQL